MQKADLRRQLQARELSETRVTELQTLLVSSSEESSARQQRLEAAERELGLVTKSREQLSSEVNLLKAYREPTHLLAYWPDVTNTFYSHS